MARNTSMLLDDHFVGFVEVQVNTGRCGSANDVVRDGLRLLEEHENKAQRPQDALVITGQRPRTTVMSVGSSKQCSGSRQGMR